MSRNIFLLAIGLVLLQACNLDLEPYEGLPESELIDSDHGIKGITVGNYNYLKDSYYQRNFHFFGEYGGDNISLSGTTTDHLFYCYNYQHFPAMSSTTNFWEKAYQLVVGCNKVILSVNTKTASAQQRELKGENLFLRAQTFFHLCNTFGRPYYQDPENNLGIPLKLDDDLENIPHRSSVEEVYQQVISDLKEAEQLMTSRKPNIYATKEAVQALLSRVYLYMSGSIENPNKEYALMAVEYATKVIDSEIFHLLNTEVYKTYFQLAPEENIETIFAVKHLPDIDDRGWNSIGSMYNYVNQQGWAEMFASEPYRELLGQNMEDVRHSFIEPQYEQDGVTLQKRNGYPKYYINKFSLQEGYPTLSSPVYIRLAEIYLNRAEGNARAGHEQAALDDVNLLRERAGLSGQQLYTIDDLKGRESVLAVVLEERRLELAFEAHRRWDIFRNGLTLDRRYSGVHENDFETLLISPEHLRVVFFIPESQMIVQDNLVQNP
ncbi:RagB/SusD family nutrient uptake outer membrane protein [Carboxylicivirga mesophila]|uniref:RagB/SusD family nutrient uptake outer membrane protein n=1 Tax=Carboxylicivirga mesophila TaxID=1166478 RepID=A0ABS5K800_9BACT|nr:RagB/SusD family nutrient uptake outer membrane protein [Carboxylicivirga mesophila]MBS2211123.1 RagB/SusD family nutrient uptake outer membrane protein [Carboxylicivirga mesophila]